jgi:uncharacterized membrane protein YraQ (UPF0718 family)
MKKNRVVLGFLFLLALANVCLYILNREKGLAVLLTGKNYLLEMLSILPPILILVGLFEVWVPKPVIERAMGRSSGLKGILVSYFVGTAAMGPLYVAFPIGLSLLQKGASLFNVSIFLCVWASIKIPMILFEVKFLGADFAFLRLALTIPGIMAISWILNLVLKRSRHYEEA